MASWLDKARDNMLRYSSGQAWPAVMKEWSVTGGFIDSHSINKTCELCDNEGLRYQFQITNLLTHYSLWVGSTCINKFVPVFVGGRELLGEEKEAEVRKIMAAARATSRQERAKSVLAQLKIKAPDRFSDPKWVANLDVGYSASQLKMIAVLCKSHRITFFSGDFKINTRKANVVDQIRLLEPWQYFNMRDAIPKSRHKQFDAWFKAKKNR